MKKLTLTTICAMLAIATLAQAPERFSFQAVIRNSANELILNSPIGMKTTILQGSPTGSIVYEELYHPNPQTNPNGLVTLEIGSGLVLSGIFSNINWANGPYYIKTEADPTGGTNYTITGISQLMSVPYSLHSKTAETLSEPIIEYDPVFTAWDKSEGIIITESQIVDLQNYLINIFGESINNLSDVDLTGLVAGKVMKYNADSEKWVVADDLGIIEETDPLFTAWDKSTGIIITESQIIDLQNYLTNILSESIGDLADVDLTGLAAGKILKYNADSEKWIVADDLGITVETDPIFTAWDRSEGITIVESQILDLQDYLTEEADPVFSASPASLIDLPDIDNWNEAHEWGDHAEVGYLTEETQTMADVLSKGNDANSMRIKNLAMPTEDLDAATKHYVDFYWEEFKGSEPGEMKYWDGVQWVEIVPGGYGQGLFFCNGVPTWGGCLPIVTTSEIIFDWIPAIGGGNVVNDGGSHVTQRGVCWSTFENPTIDGNEGFSIDGTGLGEFTSTLYGLSLSTVYNVKAYAINSVGISYGEQIVFSTPDWECGQPYTFYYRGQEVTYGTILRGGLCWMDRNLGASRVPTSMSDSQGYGDLFQWGRLDDGHQDRQSNTTNTLSNTDVPGHDLFIRATSSPNDWRTPQNNNLWQGVEGINNPCPPGWRLPTETELNTERLSWSPNNRVGAYASTLKWTVGGVRNETGSFFHVGSNGAVWSYNISGTQARAVRFDSSVANMTSYDRAHTASLRCLKD